MQDEKNEKKRVYQNIYFGSGHRGELFAAKVVQFARKRETNMSELVRFALMEYMDAHQDDVFLKAPWEK